MTDKITCLHDKHVALGAKMVSFGGFDMPLQYTDITEEHLAVRHHCGVFDVSHMGEVEVTGEEAEAFVQYLFTNDVAGAPVGKIFYGMMLRPSGGVVDDLLVYKMGATHFLLVINAANIDKDYDWIVCQKESIGFQCSAENFSDRYGQIAIQGPEAERVVGEVLGLPCADLVFYTFRALPADGETIILSRTGYTGEDGFELYGSHDYIRHAWDSLIGSGRCLPCGLGCRDTLRFEVGLPLYGDELSEDITPIEAGLSIFVKPDKGDFIGRETCIKQKANGVAQRLVGLELASRAIPRHGYDVVSGEEVVGQVTTGYSSPSTGKSVAMAFVRTEFAKLGTPLAVRIHKKLHPATVVKKRFYEKSYKR